MICADNSTIWLPSPLASVTIAATVGVTRRCESFDKDQLMRLLGTLSLLVCLLFIANGLRAQETPAASLPPGADPGAADPAADDSPPPLREQTIYIPYSKLREVFEQIGRASCRERV